MKIFELPEMEINRFSVDDVITMSDPAVTPTVNTLTKGSGNAAGNDIISDVTTYSINYVDMGA